MKSNEIYSTTWFGQSNSNGFGSSYDNINNSNKFINENGRP